MSVLAQVIPMFGGSDAAREELEAELRPSLEKTKIRAVGHDILIAMYNRANKKTSGGIIIPGSNREDEFQGKVGMIVSLGPKCCEEHDDDGKLVKGTSGYNEWFGGRPPQIGEWWGVSSRDGVSTLVGKTACRLVEWKYLRFQTQAPDEVM